ncbi:uncharacterized protein J3D65DRAFT_643163 [Phyllosticta citribraziliensis]|uniref:Uncharacterized protein n=1 Tax=Phyllosticta citribraziliensis TaxID=989973 RepID=A0ABR1L1M7_9PEZI
MIVFLWSFRSGAYCTAYVYIGMCVQYLRSVAGRVVWMHREERRCFSAAAGRGHGHGGTKMDSRGLLTNAPRVRSLVDFFAIKSPQSLSKVPRNVPSPTNLRSQAQTTCSSPPLQSIPVRLLTARPPYLLQDLFAAKPTLPRSLKGVCILRPLPTCLPHSLAPSFIHSLIHLRDPQNSGQCARHATLHKAPSFPIRRLVRALASSRQGVERHVHERPARRLSSPRAGGGAPRERRAQLRCVGRKARGRWVGQQGRGGYDSLCAAQRTGDTAGR